MPYIMPSGSGITTMSITSTSVLTLSSTPEASPVRASPSSASTSSPLSPKLGSTYSRRGSLSLSISSAPPAPVPGGNIADPTSSRVGYLYPPPLVKALSDTNTHRLSWPTASSDFMQAAAAARGQYGYTPVDSSSSSSAATKSTASLTNSPKKQVRASPPLIRRAASASAASPPPVDTATRFANAAGKGLMHIPRRTSHTRNESTTSVNGEKAPIEEVRGRRGRSRFVLGAAHGESSDDMSEEDKDKEMEERSVEKCAARKRPVSADRSRALKKQIIFVDVGADSVGVEVNGHFKPENDKHGRTEDDEGSGSECATPTPRSVSKGKQGRAAVVGTKDGLAEQRASAPPRITESKVENDDVSATSNSIAPSISVRSHRGRGRRRAVFDDEDVDDEAEEQKDETSTISFPKSEPSSPPQGSDALELPQFAVIAPTPQSSPQVQQDERMDVSSSSSVGQKRGVGALHINIAPQDAKDANSKRGYVPNGSNYSPPSNSNAEPPATAPATMTTIPRTVSESGSTLSVSASLSELGMPLIRKKSGEVVKSALRRSSSAPRPAHGHRASQSMSDISSVGLSPSLSAPSSPQLFSSASVPKMVHFGLDMEEVRLFRSEQKPAAVSRGGSPSLDDTTSGGESEDGSGGFDVKDFRAWQRKRKLMSNGGGMSDEEDAVRRALTMRVLNMPRRSPWADSNVGGNSFPSEPKPFASVDDSADDVLLEGFRLTPDATSVNGTVRVKNIAFEKNIAVRFTFDGWQTTSEVLARWVESCPGPHAMAMPLPPSVTPSPPMSSEGQFNNTIPFPSSGPASINTTDSASNDPALTGPQYDRFEFSIRLQDMLLRIDEKTLVLAVRYRAAGLELWDNNGGQNYRAVFERRAQTSLSFTGAMTEWSGSGSGNSGPTGGPSGDSKNGAGFGQKAGGLGLSLTKELEKVASGDNGDSNNAKKAKDSLEALVSPTKKPAADSLASRYNLGASLKDKTPFSRPTLESYQTWTGGVPSFTGPFPGQRVPRSRSGVGHGQGHGHDMFAAHAVAFSTRGLARGSPRDFGSTKDDADVRLSTMRFSSNVDDIEDLPFARGRKDSVEKPPLTEGAYQLGPGPVPGNQQPQRQRAHYRSHTGMTGYFDGVPLASSSGNGVTSPAGARAVGFGASRVRMTPPGSPGALASGHRTLSLDSAGLSMSPSTSLAGTPSLEMTPTMHFAAYSHVRSGSSLDAQSTSNSNSSSSSPSSMAAWNAGGHFWGPVGNGLGIAVPNGTVVDAADSEVSTPSIASVLTSPTVTSPASPPDYGMLSPLVTPGGGHTLAGAAVMRESTSLDSSDYASLFHRICRFTGSETDPDPELLALDLAPSTGDIHRSHSDSGVNALLTNDGGYYGKGSPRAGATPTMSSVASAFENAHHHQQYQSQGRYSPGGANAVTPTAAHFAASVRG